MTHHMTVSQLNFVCIIFDDVNRNPLFTNSRAIEMSLFLELSFLYLICLSGFLFHFLKIYNFYSRVISTITLAVSKYQRF